MTNDAIRELGEPECWELLARAPYGRMAVAAGGELDIFPVNHTVHDGGLVFRTAAGTKLAELTIDDRVAFEVDGQEDGEAYSVVVKGHAAELRHGTDVADAAATGLHAWSAAPKDRWVRISPTQITGRRFAITAEGDDDEQPDD